MHTSLPNKNNITRIFYINANGFKTEHSDKLQEITSYMSENEIDIFGISETNIDTNDNHTYPQLKKAIRKNLTDKNSYLTASATRTPTKTI